MPTLAMIHTVSWYDRSVIQPFAVKFSQDHPEVRIVNIMDDSLLEEALAYQGPNSAVKRRMVAYALAAEAAGADVVMSTCTTMAPGTELAKPLLSIPIFNIDEPMANEAVRLGRRLAILATVPTSAPATRFQLEAAARRAGVEIQMETRICEPAFQALTSGREDEHNALVHDAMDELARTADVIVLGQISLSRIQHRPPGVPVLQVGHSGFAEARRLLQLAPARESVLV